MRRVHFSCGHVQAFATSEDLVGTKQRCGMCSAAADFPILRTVVSDEPAFPPRVSHNEWK